MTDVIKGSLQKLKGKEWLLIFGGTLGYSIYWNFTFRPVGFPPGPAPVPFLGTLFTEKEQVDELIELGKKYGPVFSISKMGVKPCVIVNDYEIFLKDIKPKANVFIDRPQIAINSVLEADKGIVFSSGSRWETARAFASDALKHYGMGKGKMYESIWLEASQLVKLLNGKINESGFIDPAECIQLAVTNIIMQLVFGERFEYGDPGFTLTMAALQDESLNEETLYLRLLFEYTGFLRYIPRSWLEKTKQFKDVLAFMDYVNKKAEERERTYDPNNPTCVLDLFCKERRTGDNPIAEPGVLGICIMDLFGAGSDTTQNIIRWSLKILCKFPGLQEELLSEITNVIGLNNIPTAEQLLKMAKLNAFIHEVMRYVSLVPVGVQHCPIEDVIIAGYHVPAGTPVFINQYAIHHDPKYWKYPDEFSIYNFLDDQGNFECKAQFMPFGWGKRTCIGSALARSEIFVFLVKLIQEYSISFSGSYSMASVGDFLRRPCYQELKFEQR